MANSKLRLNLGSAIGYLLFLGFVGLIVFSLVSSGKSDNKPTGTNTVNGTSNASSNSTNYPTSDPNQFTASQLFSVIDGARITGGIVALQEDASLDGAANLRAYQIQQNGTSYQSGSSYIFQRVSNAIPATTYADEIYQPLCDGATTSATYASLVGNDAVYQQLNDPKYTYAGVGIVKSDPGKCNGYAVIELADVN